MMELAILQLCFMLSGEEFAHVPACVNAVNVQTDISVEYSLKYGRPVTVEKLDCEGCELIGMQPPIMVRDYVPKGVYRR